MIKKILIPVGVLSVIILILITNNIISKKSAKCERLEIALAMEQAVREVEVSIWETSNAVFCYMLRLSKMDLEEYKKQLSDVENFINKYKELINTEKEELLVAKFEKMWDESVSKAEEIIKLRNDLAELEKTTWDTVYQTDDVINYKIKALFVDTPADVTTKQEIIDKIKSNIWEDFQCH